MRRTLLLSLYVLVSLPSCTDDGVGVQCFGPSLAGTYDFEAPFDGMPGIQYAGSFTLVRDPCDQPAFSGTYSGHLYDGERAVGPIGGTIIDGLVSEQGEIEWKFDASDWSFTGEIEDLVVTGTWVRVEGASTWSGTLTATRR